MHGRYCRLEPLTADHAADLYTAFQQAADGRLLQPVHHCLVERHVQASAMDADFGHGIAGMPSARLAVDELADVAADITDAGFSSDDAFEASGDDGHREVGLGMVFCGGGDLSVFRG